MDLGTLIGLVVGFLLVLTSILMGGSASIFIHIPSLLVVFGGAICAAMIGFRLKDIIGVAGVLKKAFQDNSKEGSDLVNLITGLAKISRREGPLALDRELATIEDEFLKVGVEMLVDGNDGEVIRDMMETELSYLMTRHSTGADIFNSLGSYAPAFGMIGTLIGLIAMLQELEDPTNIGAGMAVALITTFYGALGANLVFLPLAKKLQNRSTEEVVLKELIIEGVVAIQQGEHPNNIFRKLQNFLPPEQRATEAPAEAVAAG